MIVPLALSQGPARVWQAGLFRGGGHVHLPPLKTAVAVLLAALIAGCAPGSSIMPRPSGRDACATVRETLMLAGVRATVVRPVQASPDTPVLVALHGLGEPATPAAFADLVGPLPGIVAVYPELPFTNGRLPPGGQASLLTAQADDYAGRIFYPIVSQAVADLPRLIAAARPFDRARRPGPVAVLGFSIGGAAALHALSQTPVNAAAALNAPLSTAQAIAAFERRSGRSQRDTPAMRVALEHYDFPAAQRGPSRRPVLIMTGNDDELYRPGDLLGGRDTLATGGHRGPTIVSLPGLAHQAPARDPTGRLQPYVPPLRAAIRDWLRQAFPQMPRLDCPA